MLNQISRLDHLNFTVSNFEESVAWYQKIFNFELVEKGRAENGYWWGILKSGETMLAISEAPEKRWYTGSGYHQTYHFGLRLVDKDEWETKLRENNLEVYYSSPVIYPHSTSWYVKDPTGNKIEVAIWNNDQVVFD